MKIFISPPSFIMTHISWVMFFLVVVIAIRLMWDLKKDTVRHRRIYGCLIAGVFVSSLLFFYKTWAVWSLLVVCGFMLGCAVLSRNRKPVVQYVLTALAFVLVGCGIAGINAPFAPVLVMGPSMWPTSPKNISVALLNTTAFSNTSLQYGDDVYFEVKGSSTWPTGRYRKRIWALPGDEIEIANNKVLLNQKVIADCSDRHRRIAPNVWWCTVTFPNGVQRDVTWGLSNTTYLSASHTVMKDNQAFAIGDNTVESTDSRFLEPVYINWIEGRFDGKSHPTPWVPWM